MSLEGLDAAPLAEAFETAQAEPGGWFWIKYASRDEVELLTKGGDGAAEMRAAAAKEPDESPLYGFIRFRRRRILVKYLPEGTSRVLKARSQVHFSLFAERFSPHDTTCTIMAPTELTDSGLNASCSTHTATASISSSNSSLRQRRLADIAESAEEQEEAGRMFPRTQSPVALHRSASTASSALTSVNSGRNDGSHTLVAALGGPALIVTHAEPDARPEAETGPGVSQEMNGRPNDRDADAATTTPSRPSSSDPQSSGTTAPPPPPAPSFSSSATASLLDLSHSPSFLTEPRRKSTSSARPDIYSYYPYAPKVKLGPRPHVESLKRPHTSNERVKTFQSHVDDLRAAIPKSVQIPSKKQSTLQPFPPRSSSNFPAIEPPQPPKEERPVSPGSVLSLKIPNSSAASVKEEEGPAPLPPEKARLMKALQLRRRNLEEKKEMDTVEQTPAQESGDDVKAESMESEPDEGKTVGTPETTEPTATLKESVPTVLTPTEMKPTTMSVPEVRVEEDGEVQELIETEEIKKEEGPKQEDIKEDVDIVEVLEVRKEVTEIKEEPQEEKPKTPETPATPEEPEKAEGTKVRDDVDDESEAESSKSAELTVTTPRTITASPVSPTLPAIAKSIHYTSQPKSSDASPPRVLKRTDRRIEDSSPIPANETPVIETARSVSAPFLKSARVQVQDSKPVVARKVNVSSGSVSQRIRQFQQLATNSPPKNFVTPPRTPSLSRSNSPTPEFLQRPLSSAGTKTSPPVVRKYSFNASAPSTAPGASPPRDERHSSPPAPQPKEAAPPKVEIVEKDNRPQLQVTTKITRPEERIPLPGLSPSTGPSPIQKLSASPRNPSPPKESHMSRRKSLDISSVVDSLVSTGRRTSMDESRPDRAKSPPPKDRPRLFSRASNRDNLGGLPEGTVSPTNGSSENSRRGSTSSGSKTPSFLKRVSSSLARMKDGSSSNNTSPTDTTQPKVVPATTATTVAAAAAAAAAAPPPSPPTFLLIGWINVQLPDTMLWRRRCIKVNSRGWLFLSVSDDENAPQSRRYHIPRDVQMVDLPDVDEQELPYSVRLMLREGGMLQCACQNGAEQKEVMKVIKGCVSLPAN